MGVSNYVTTLRERYVPASYQHSAILIMLKNIIIGSKIHSISKLTKQSRPIKLFQHRSMRGKLKLPYAQAIAVIAQMKTVKE